MFIHEDFLPDEESSAHMIINIGGDDVVARQKFAAYLMKRAAQGGDPVQDLKIKMYGEQKVSERSYALLEKALLLRKKKKEHILMSYLRDICCQERKKKEHMK